MSHSDRGVAVAMSLGGRAGRIAQSIPHNVLSRADGLFILLSRLEGDLGAELQDRVRMAAREFQKYRRPKGMNSSEFLVEFERRFSEAQQHGLNLNVTMLTLQLLEAAQLSEAQESWVLQTCAGDLTQYQTIRRALRRMPQLDTRHQDSSAWVTQQENPAWQTPNPFQDHHLNCAPAESSAASADTSLHEDYSDYYPLDDEDSDSDDDYCSTCPTCEDEQTCELLTSAFAIVNHRKRFVRKQNGGKRFYRKGAPRKRSAWAIDNQRNASDTVPPGWDAKRWLARSKCPGCGSRWHRNCGGQGKAYKIMRQKGQRKGSGGKHGGGGNGNGKGGNGKGGGLGKGSGFGIFMLTAASMLGNATAAIQNLALFSRPMFSEANVFKQQVSNNTTEPLFSNAQCFSHSSWHHDDMSSILPIDQKWTQAFTQLTDSSSHACSNLSSDVDIPHDYHTDHQSHHEYTLPKQIPNDIHVIHAWHLHDHVNNSFVDASNVPNVFIGIEPLSMNEREKLWKTYTPSSRLRYALMLDSGAPESAAGEQWISRFITAHNLEADTYREPF